MTKIKEWRCFFCETLRLCNLGVCFNLLQAFLVSFSAHRVVITRGSTKTKNTCARSWLLATCQWNHLSSIQVFLWCLPSLLWIHLALFGIKSIQNRTGATDDSPFMDSKLVENGLYRASNEWTFSCQQKDHTKIESWVISKWCNHSTWPSLDTWCRREIHCLNLCHNTKNAVTNEELRYMAIFRTRYKTINKLFKLL